MISRPFWLERIESCWRKAPIVWLSGVRRAGKTTLAETLDDAEFLNCDLPSSQQLLADPEAFYRSLAKPRLILDEVHQLPDPSRLLKIGADAFPKLKILATGSSTLAATFTAVATFGPTVTPALAPTAFTASSPTAPTRYPRSTRRSPRLRRRFWTRPWWRWQPMPPPRLAVI